MIETFASIGTGGERIDPTDVEFEDDEDPAAGAPEDEEQDVEEDATTAGGLFP